MSSRSGYWDKTLQIWHHIIPRQDDRIPITVHNIHKVLGPLLPLLFMSYLVQRPNTHLYRLAMVAFTAYSILKGSFGYYFEDKKLIPYNFALGILGIAALGKALEFGFSKQGRFRVRRRKSSQGSDPALNFMYNDAYNAPSKTGMRKPSPYAYSTNSPNIHLTELKGPTGDGMRAPSMPSLRAALPSLPATNQLTPTRYGLPRNLKDATELLCSARGIGWDFGQNLHLVPQSHPKERGSFLIATLRSFFLSFLMFDLIESCLKTIPGFVPPASGSIFFINSPSILEGALTSHWVEKYPYVATLVARYTVSTGITLFIGIGVMLYVSLLYDLIAILCVGILCHQADNWPPLFDYPWVSVSVADFWSRRWHQILRQTFFSLGGFPLQYAIYYASYPFWGDTWSAAFGKVGLVMGTFMASGLLHAVAVYAMGGPVDHRATVYFSVQGVALLIERGWKVTTGRRVGGWYGRLWAYLVVIPGLQLVVDGWSTQGLFNGLFIPTSISPTRIVLFPLLNRLLAKS